MPQVDEVTIDDPEAEVVLGESVSEDSRRIMVYKSGGNFVIDVPAGAKVTFGYFNPASAGFQINQGYNERQNVSKQTALRIYERGEKGNQLACFIGVDGFRDLVVKRTNLAQKVTVERRFVKEADGSEQWNGAKQIEAAAVEEEVPF